MMFTRCCRSMMTMGLLLGLASAAMGQDILSVTQPSGPGGTGTTAIDTQYPGINSLLDVGLNFTSVAPISFSFDVDGAGGYTLHATSGVNPNFMTGIVNDTGQAWDGFIFSVDTSLGAGPNGLEVFNYFNSGVIGASAITLGDGIVPPGADARRHFRGRHPRGDGCLGHVYAAVGGARTVQCCDARPRRRGRCDRVLYQPPAATWSPGW